MAGVPNPITLTRGAIEIVLELTRLAGGVAFRTTRSVGDLAVQALRPGRDSDAAHPPDPRPMPMVPYGDPWATSERSEEEPPKPLPAQQVPSRPLTRRKASTPQRRAPSKGTRTRARSEVRPARSDRPGSDPAPAGANAGRRRAEPQHSSEDGAGALGRAPAVEDVNVNASVEARRHVDAGAALVAESADPGAQDGAGAAVHVEQPWEGYSKMRVPEVIDRLPAQPHAAISLVLLYERSHRARRSVLDAAERELKARVAAPASRTS